MRHLIWMLTIIITHQLSAQNTFQSGLLPEIGITKSLGKQLNTTFKMESRQGVYDSDQPTDEQLVYSFDRTDLQGFLGYRLNPLLTLDLGYQYRFNRQAVNSHRTIQQVAVVQRLPGVKLAHRARTDQTFSPDEAFEFRTRYRLAMQWSLQGASLDPGEYYLTLSDETLLSSQGGESGLENRVVGALGRSLTINSKLEAGLDYRMDRLIEAGFRQRLWLKVGWFWSW